MAKIATPLKDLITAARLRLLDLHYENYHGHIGGDFSCVDALIVLFNSVMQKEDQFILSKGHAAGALYTALWTKGELTDNYLKTFTRDGTLLGIHPPVKGLDSVLFGTGSLGHGPSLSAGLALGKKLKNEVGRVFCLCGDGEWQEGACWEALMFATHRKLGNLTLIVDANGWQGFGSTQSVLSIDQSKLAERMETFGATVSVCNGHDANDLRDKLSTSYKPGIPSVIIMNTVKGNGIPAIENTLASHYLPLTAEQYKEAKIKIGGGNA